MDTKKAIERLKGYTISREDRLLEPEEASVIISLLQRGEKFESIVKDLCGLCDSHIAKAINKLHRKHFPEQYKFSDEEVIKK